MDTHSSRVTCSLYSYVQQKTDAHMSTCFKKRKKEKSMHNSAADQMITSLQTEEVIPDLSVLYSLIDRE